MFAGSSTTSSRRLAVLQPGRMRLLTAAKVAWLVFVAVFVVVRGTTEYNRLAAYSFDVRWSLVGYSTALLLLGRLVQVLVVQTAARRVGRRFRYAEMLRLFSITDLGRYAPGGLVHFLGRGFAYAEDGVSKTDILRAFALENLWLAFGATHFGVVALAATWRDRLPPLPLVYAAATLLLLVAYALSLKLAARGSVWRGVLVTSLQQLALWMLYGLSFWVLCRALGIVVSAPVAAGALSLAWVCGFVSVFAPAGLGVREYILVLLLSSAGTATVPAAIVSVVNRLQWILMELTLCALGLAWSRRRSPPHDG